MIITYCINTESLKTRVADVLQLLVVGAIHKCFEAAVPQSFVCDHIQGIIRYIFRQWITGEVILPLHSHAIDVSIST